MTTNLAAVTNLLVAGHSVSEAAERLGITHGQVRHAEKVAMQRAGVRRRGDLMRAHGNAEPVVPHANRTSLDVQRAIVARRAAGETNKAIALRYGLSESGVSRICTRARVLEANEHAARELAEMEAV
jgi:DNA-binding CsgD family transcriptional regulator